MSGRLLSPRRYRGKPVLASRPVSRVRLVSMSVALTSPSASSPVQPEPLRVMLVDDSVVIRGMISRWLSSEPDIVVAASLRTGLEAVNQVERINPDIAILDIEMPEPRRHFCVAAAARQEA